MFINFSLVLVAFIVVLLAMLSAASLRIFREYERGVVFRLGRLRPGADTASGPAQRPPKWVR